MVKLANEINSENPVFCVKVERHIGYCFAHSDVSGVSDACTCEYVRKIFHVTAQSVLVFPRVYR